MAGNPDRFVAFLGKLGGVDREHGGFRILSADFGGELLLVDRLHEGVVPGVVADESLEVPHLGRSGEFAGDGLDALSAEVGEESQGIEPGVLRAVPVREDGGEILVEDHELAGESRQILFAQLFAFREKIGGTMVGLGQNEAVGRSRRTGDERDIQGRIGFPELPGPGRSRFGLGPRKKAALDPELRVENRRVDVLDLTEVGVFDPALSGEPLGLAQAQKSGGAVAGAGMVDRIHEALYDAGGESEPPLPVGVKTAERLSQHMGGEIFDPDPRKDENSAVIDQAGPGDLLLLGRPADPAVPDLDLGGRSGKGEGRHGLLHDPGDVLDPTAGKLLVAQGMVLPHQGVPARLVLGADIDGLDGDLPQTFQGPQENPGLVQYLRCRFQPPLLSMVNGL